MTVNRRAINQEKERVAQIEAMEYENRAIAFMELQRAIKALEKLQSVSVFPKLYDVAISTLHRILIQLQEKEL